MIWRTAWSIWSKTPIPDRIDQSTATMTTIAMPRATDSRTDIFMTDHGSTRETVSFTRRPLAAPRATEAAAPDGLLGEVPDADEPPDVPRGRVTDPLVGLDVAVVAGAL